MVELLRTDKSLERKRTPDNSLAQVLMGFIASLALVSKKTAEQRSGFQPSKPEFFISRFLATTFRTKRKNHN